MTCQELVRTLDPYLDDELSVMETLRVQGHLICCEPCRKAAESEALLHSMILADAVEDEAPLRLRERILERVSAEPAVFPGAPSRPRRWVFPRAFLAAAAAVGLLAGVLLIPGGKGLEGLSPLTAEVVAKHLLYGGAGTALEMTTSQAPLMAAWLERRLGFPVKVPLLARPGERLVGGRVSSVADLPAAYLLYERGGHRTSLFIARSLDLAPSGVTRRVVEGEEFYLAALRGIDLVWWEDGELLYAAASAAGGGDLLEFALLCVRSGRPSRGGETRSSAAGRRPGHPGQTLVGKAVTAKRNGLREEEQG